MELTEQQIKIIEKVYAIDDIDKSSNLLLEEIKDLLSEAEAKKTVLQNYELEIKKLIEEKTKGFPWLANAIAEYHEFLDLQIADFLEKKKWSAETSAQKIKAIAREKRNLRKNFLIASNIIKYYESLFPWLEEYRDDDIDELIKQVWEEKEEEIKNDPVTIYVPANEYHQLSVVERNQKALDRYLSSRKYSWQIGRDYERYVGYLKEKESYDVHYVGIESGLEDLGRDLICKKNGKVEIIQCKCWAQHKTIHEKHINQLFGTTVKYFIDQQGEKNNTIQFNLFPDVLKNGSIKAIFYSSTKFSDTAKQFAETLGIELYGNFSLKPYPLIKCHVNKQTSEKIYHLPFDQQYDKTILENRFGEFYAMTVREAEEKGFRRAWKWRGNNG